MYKTAEQRISRAYAWMTLGVLAIAGAGVYSLAMSGTANVIGGLCWLIADYWSVPSLVAVICLRNRGADASLPLAYIGSMLVLRFLLFFSALPTGSQSFLHDLIFQNGGYLPLEAARIAAMAMLCLVSLRRKEVSVVLAPATRKVESLSAR